MIKIQVNLQSLAFFRLLLEAKQIHIKGILGIWIVTGLVQSRTWILEDSDFILIGPNTVYL